MFMKSPFDTVALSAVPFKHLIEAVTRALVAAELPTLTVKAGDAEEGFQIYMVQGGNSFADQVPFFNHPLLFTHTAGGRNEKVCVIDVRNFGRYNANEKSFIVRAPAEYALAIRRAILTHLWTNGKGNVIRDLSDLPAMTFCALLSESIGHRFSANPFEQSVLATLAAFFYYCQFTDASELGEVESAMLQAKIAKITSVPATTVAEVLKDVNCLHGIESFVDVVKSKINGPAFENFNLGTLFTLMRGSWFGTGAAEMVGVALEHPPTWISLVDASVASQTYKRTSMARISQRFTRGNIAVSFMRAVDALVGGPNAVLNDGKVDTDYSSQCRL